MLSIENIRLIRQHHKADLRVLVETGTYTGISAKRAKEEFPVVHTIEIDPRFYRRAEAELSPLGIQCHLGSSAEIVPRLAVEIQEPVFWFLDAHWFDTRAWGHKEWTELDPSPLPLWAELATIAQRPYADVIVVDDANDFGTTNPTPEWAEITMEKIVACFGSRPCCFAVFDNLAAVSRHAA